MCCSSVIIYEWGKSAIPEMLHKPRFNNTFLNLSLPLPCVRRHTRTPTISQPFTSLPLSQSLSTAHPSIITSEETSYSIQTHNQRDTHKNILSSTRWPKTSYDVAIISVSILRCWHLNNYNYSLSTLLRQMRLDVATYPKFLQRTEHQRGPQHNACNWGGIQKHPETWIPAITQQYNDSNHL